MESHSSLRRILLAILACFLWSTAFVGIKIGLRYSQPFSFAGIRFLIAGVLLVPFWWKKRPSFPIFSHHAKMILVLSFFQTFLTYIFFYIGMMLLSGALAAIVVGASPVISAIMAHFLTDDDEMNLKKALSLLLGIAGISIISLSKQPWSFSGFMQLLGILSFLLSSACGTFGNILVAKEKHALPPLFLNSIQIFLGGFGILIFSIPLEGIPTLKQPLEFYAALLWLSGVSAAAFSLWFFLLRQPGVKVSELNIWKFVTPISGAMLSWMLLPDESPQWVQIVGMLCIAVSIVSFHLVVLSQRRDVQKVVQIPQHAVK